MSETTCASSKQITSATTPMVVQNPYTKRNPISIPRSIITDHYDEMTKITMGSTRSTVDTEDDIDVVGCCENDDDDEKKDLSTTTTTTTTTTPDSETMALPKDNSSTAISFNLPIWERLPSRNITFGSAEILTIPEAYHRFRKANHYPCSSSSSQPSPSSSSLHDIRNDPSVMNVCPIDDSTTNNRNNIIASIRVTGLVLHRVVHDDASVSLILGDPLATLTPLTPNTPCNGIKRKTFSTTRDEDDNGDNHDELSMNTTTTIVTKRQRVSNSNVDEPQNTTTATTTTPNDQEEFQTPHTCANECTASDVKPGILVKKNTTGTKPQKLVYIKKRNHSSPVRRRVTLAEPPSHRMTPSTNADNNDNNSPLSLLLHSLLRQPNHVARVWVISDSLQQTHHHHPVCNVNDLVMVIGEVQTFRTGKKNQDKETTPTDLNPNTHDNNETPYVSDILSMNHGRCAALTDILPKIGGIVEEEDDSDEHFFYVQARILRIVNGTHMKLHTDALQMRRAFLQQQSLMKSQRLD